MEICVSLGDSKFPVVNNLHPLLSVARDRKPSPLDIATLFVRAGYPFPYFDCPIITGGIKSA